MLRIREAREAHGWTQEKLANELGTTQQTIQRWETGAVDPKISNVVATSELLGVTVSYLLGTDARNAPLPDTTDESRLLELYRKLNGEDRSMLVAMAERLSR